MSLKLPSVSMVKGVGRALMGRGALAEPIVEPGELTVPDRLAPGRMYTDQYDDTVVLEHAVVRIWTLADVPNTLAIEQLHQLYYGQKLPLRVVINWRISSIEEGKRLVKRRATQVMANTIRLQQAGRIPDPGNIHESDELMDQLTRQAVTGESLFWLNILLFLYGRDKAELEEGARVLERQLEERDFRAYVVRENHDLAMQAAMPLGLLEKSPEFRRDERSSSPRLLSVLYPHGVRGYDEERGIVFGLHPARDTIVRVDLFRSINLTTILTGRPGAGKSTLMKSMIEQAAIAGEDVSVIDLEGEYVSLVRDVLGGEVIELGGAGSAINPLDMKLSHDDPEVAFNDLIDVLSILAEQDIAGTLRSEVKQVWSLLGVRQPILWEFLERLRQASEDCKRLAIALEQYVEGDAGEFFNRQTNVKLRSPLRCFVVNRAAQVGPAGRALLYLTQKFGMYGGLTTKGRSWSFIDEGWNYFGGAQDARRMVELVVRARKRSHAVVIVAPDAAQIEMEDAGRILLRQAATHILMEQDLTALRSYRDHTYSGLDEGDIASIAHSPVGRGMLITKRNDQPESSRVPFDVERLPGRGEVYGSQTDPTLERVA